MNEPWPASSDPLGDALHLMRLRGAFYCRSELTAPWGAELPAVESHLWLHVVTSGLCILEVDGAEPIWIERGDLTLVPHGHGHRIRSLPMDGRQIPATPSVLDLDREMIGERYEILRHGGGGPRTDMICCAVRFDHPIAANVVSVLPKILHLPASSRSARGTWLRSTLDLMAAEVDSRQPGGETIITRLADVLVVQAIRAWLERDPAAKSGWLGALGDPQLGRALSLVHGEPERAWSVADLASEVGMSRSAFSDRFTELVGESPMRYVTRWRMSLAERWLADGEQTVSEVARRVGYDSLPAFSRAFKRTVGVPPVEVRRRSATSVDLLTG